MDSYALVAVGTDGSESSLRAVERAAKLVVTSDNATLLIVCAYEEAPPETVRDAEIELAGDAHLARGSSPAYGHLQQAKGRAEKLCSAQIELLARPGGAVQVLSSVVTDRAPDLVVVGNRGLNTLSGRLLGSVPSGVSHRAGTDVLIVRTTS